MELAFAKKMLRTVCESEILAYQIFENDIAKCLITRLADLRAVDNVNQLPIGNPRSVDINKVEHLEIDLVKGVNIILSASHRNNPTQANNKIDWNQISRIKLCSIGGYDG